jgi:sulfonate transport system substrate-binding protein
VKEAKLTDSVAKAVLARTDISSAGIGERQKGTIVAAGDVLKKSGVIQAKIDVKSTVDALIEPAFSKELEAR